MKVWGVEGAGGGGGTIPLTTPILSTVGWLTVGLLKITQKVENCNKKIPNGKKKNKMGHCSPILTIRPWTRSLYDLLKRVF